MGLHLRKLPVFPLIVSVSGSPFPVFLDGVKKHHWTIAMLSFIGLSQLVFSPLASSYFTIITESHRANVSVTVLGRVGNGINNNTAGIYTPFTSATGVSPVTRLMLEFGHGLFLCRRAWTPYVSRVKDYFMRGADASPQSMVALGRHFSSR